MHQLHGSVDACSWIMHVDPVCVVSSSLKQLRYEQTAYNDCSASLFHRDRHTNSIQRVIRQRLVVAETRTPCSIQTCVHRLTGPRANDSMALTTRLYGAKKLSFSFQLRFVTFTVSCTVGRFQCLEWPVQSWVRL